MEKEQKTKVLDIKKHIKKQPMWAGKKKKADELIYMLDNNTNKFIKVLSKYSPALYKTIDEIIVNAIDHCIRYPRLVRNIRINFDESIGKITVINDGPGIPIYVVALVGDPIEKMGIVEFESMEDAQKADIKDLYKIKWNPQVLTEHPFSGSNYKDTSKEVHVRGGTNGIGMKVVNYYSSIFEIYTIDKERRKSYYQKFENGTDIIHEPIIKKVKKSEIGTGITSLSFIPNYKELGYNKDFKRINKDDKNILFKLIETRAYQAAIYANTADVYFQDERINVDTLQELVKMHLPIKQDNPYRISNSTKTEESSKINSIDESDIYCVDIKPSRPAMDIDKYKTLKSNSSLSDIDWSWTVCISPNVDPSQSTGHRYSIMNGVFLSSGAHLSYIENLLIEQLRPNVEPTFKEIGKTWRSSYISNNINIFIKGAIDSPSFDSQSKSNLKEQISKFEGFIFKPKDLKKIWDILKDYILSYALDKYNKTQNKNKTKINYIDKYKPAKLAGKKSSKSRNLYLCEGDSLRGTTPLLLLNKNEEIEIKTIDDINKFNWVLYNDREYSNSEYKVWSDNGWTDIKYIMRHKTKKRIYRVLTHIGYVEVTEDHSLLNEKGKEISPKECKIGDALLHNFPYFEENKIEIPDKLEDLTNNEIKPDEAYVFGLFWSGGFCRIRNKRGYNEYDWRIENTNLEYLEKAKKILEKHYNYEFKIVVLREKTDTHPKLYRLRAYGGRAIHNFANKWTYDKKRWKKIPSIILNAKREIRQQFFNGMYDGDGEKKTETIRIDVFGQIGAQGVYYLCRSLGYQVSINRRNDWEDIYVLVLSKKCFQKNPIKIKKIIDLGVIDDYVYDLETENHHFQAGIGQMIVHNSASSLVDKALSKKINNQTWENNGTFSVQGVPVNARRLTKIIHNKLNDDDTTLRRPKLDDNERYRALITVLGLDYNKTYKFGTKKGDEEFATLRYDNLIIAVDQDLDGTGNIFSLLASNLEIQWPELLKRGFIKKLDTPIIKAIEKSRKKTAKCIIFYSQPEYEKWVNKNFTTPEAVSEKWSIEYVKGLATNSEADIYHIFNNLNTNLTNREYTPESRKWFDTYLGSDSNKRKNELKTPDLYEIKMGATTIKYEDHLRRDTKEFQRYNVLRSLPHVMDGLNPSRRKILCAGRKYFGNNGNKSDRVSTFSGNVVQTMAYHHGEASLHGTIFKMGQEFLGSNVLPLFKGNSVCTGFGTRKCGGKDIAAPRYAKIKLNKQLVDIVYPKEDDYLLDYEFDDGERCEPRYMIPIIPMAIVENIKLPAHGWQITSWGRDIKSILSNVQKLITGEIQTPESMKINKHNWYGHFEYQKTENKTKVFSVGTYKYDKQKNIITITELPHGVFSGLLTFGSRKKEANKKEKFNNIDAHFKQFCRSIDTTGKAKYNKKTKLSTGNEFDDLQEEIDKLDTDDEEEKECKKYKSFTIKDKPVVDEVYDESTDDKINIVIKLKKHGYEYIHHLYKGVKLNGAKIDPVVEYFHLKRIIYNNLNFIGVNGEVKTYKKYENILIDWFRNRKQLYGQRVDRRIMILDLQIELLKAKNRFASNFEEYNLGKKDELIWEKKLLKEKYIMYNEQIINNPGFLPIDKIEYYAKNVNQSYKYIYNLTQREIMKEAIQKREEEIQKLEEELNNLTGNWIYFKGDNLWLSELDQAINIINNGLEKGWGFDEKKIIYT